MVERPKTHGKERVGSQNQYHQKVRPGICVSASQTPPPPFGHAPSACGLQTSPLLEHPEVRGNLARRVASAAQPAPSPFELAVTPPYLASPRIGASFILSRRADSSASASASASSKSCAPSAVDTLGEGEELELVLRYRTSWEG